MHNFFPVIGMPSPNGGNLHVKGFQKLNVGRPDSSWSIPFLASFSLIVNVSQLVGWVTYKGTEVPFPPLLRTQWHDVGGDIAWEWIKSLKAFVFPIYVMSFLAEEDKGSLAFWSTFLSVLLGTDSLIWKLKSWRGVTSETEKEKIYFYPHGFYCTSRLHEKQSYFRCFKYRSRTASKLPLASSQFFPPQWIWKNVYSNLEEEAGEASPKATSDLGYWGGRSLLKKRDWEGDTEAEEEKGPQGKGRSNRK